MSEPSGWKKWLWFLRSRKVQVAVATVIAAILADHGVEANEEVVLAILGVGAALILGIAHEDNGRNRAGPPVELAEPRTFSTGGGEG